MRSGATMIIWGSKGKMTDVGMGVFYCPRCQGKRQYVRKEVGKYFTLYFIPLFKTSALGEFIECQTCLTPFETTVLNYDQIAADNAQKMLRAIQGEIEAGVPLQAIYNGLLGEGADKDTANTIIAMATQGKMKLCKSCNLVFAATLNYCSACGNALEAVG
jgi:hypothetical protein